MEEEKKCNECNKLFPSKGKFKCYELYKELYVHNDVCESCWNKNKETYKLNCEYIWEKEISGAGEGHETTTTKALWTACKEEGCTKIYDPVSIEGLRHNPKSPRIMGGDISFDVHEELNKNPAPVNSLEELVRQWMKSMEYRKIYYKNDELRIVTKKGGEKEWWFASGIVSLDETSFKGRLTKWLKTQPNKEIVNNLQDNPNNNGNGNSNGNGNNNPSNSITLNQLEQYFIQNNIKSIKWENNRLIIEFNDDNSPNNLTTEQQTEIKDYLRNNNHRELNLDRIRQLKKQEQSPNKKNDYTPWIIGGSIIGGIAVIWLIIWLVRKKRNKSFKI